MLSLYAGHFKISATESNVGAVSSRIHVDEGFVVLKHNTKSQKYRILGKTRILQEPAVVATVPSEN